MDSPTPRGCKVCLQAPCACPDFADESDEQGAEDEAGFISRLLAVYDRAEVAAYA